MKILAIGSHPDDIEIFMFGFLSVCLRRGDNIFLTVATDGSLGGRSPGIALAKIRKKEAINGLKSLGKPNFLNFKDGSLHDQQDVTFKIKKLIHNIQPDLVVTHSPEDYHPDHRYLSKYVKDAASFCCPVLYSDTLMGVNFIPEYYIDITQFFEAKMLAILEHKSQNPKKFFQAIEILNGFRSAQCNSPIGNYAEAYRFDKSFPFSDIRTILPPSPKYKPYYQNNSDSLI